MCNFYTHKEAKINLSISEDIHCFVNMVFDLTLSITITRNPPGNWKVPGANPGQGNGFFISRPPHGILNYYHFLLLVNYTPTSSFLIF